MTRKNTQTAHPGDGYMLWLGDQKSFNDFMYAEEGLMNHLKSGEGLQTGCCGAETDEDETPSRLLQVIDGVAVISIHGSLTNRDSWMNKFMGMVSYNEIRAAFIQAFNDDSVTHILQDVASGGGAVAGVSDTANLIKEVGKVKPVTTFSDASMASAAYWLGSSAGTIKISNTAVVGSIAVIMHHMEYSKMLTEAGITSTMLRSGKYKALINPYEPLSELALEEADKQMMHIDQVFVQAVADNLGATYPDVQSNMAQGREFVGSQALKVGMVDGIASFDEVMGELVEKSKASAGDGDNNNNNLYMESGNMKKQALSKAAIEAAVAAGADRSQFTELPAETLEASVATASDAAAAAATSSTAADVSLVSANEILGAAKQVVEAAGDKVPEEATAAVIAAEELVATATTAAATAVTEAGKAKVASDDTAKAIDVSAATVTVELAITAAKAASEAEALAASAVEKAGTATPEPKANNLSQDGEGVVAELRTQLQEKDQKLIDLNVEMSQLKTANETMVASTDGLEQIARNSINQMRVGLGGSISDLSAVKGAELLAAHSTAAADFTKTFKVGGVASTEADTGDRGDVEINSKPSAAHTASVKAASIN